LYFIILFQTALDEARRHKKLEVVAFLEVCVRVSLHSLFQEISFFFSSLFFSFYFFFFFFLFLFCFNLFSFSFFLFVL